MGIDVGAGKGIEVEKLEYLKGEGDWVVSSFPLVSAIAIVVLPLCIYGDGFYIKHQVEIIESLQEDLVNKDITIELLKYTLDDVVLGNLYRERILSLIIILLLLIIILLLLKIISLKG